MTTIALLAAAAVAMASLLCALMLCLAAARADRRVRSALLEALGWNPQDEWAAAQKQPTAGVRYKQRATS
jgi:hypothetical protein